MMMKTGSYFLFQVSYDDGGWISLPVPRVVITSNVQSIAATDLFIKGGNIKSRKRVANTANHSVCEQIQKVFTALERYSKNISSTTATR